MWNRRQKDDGRGLLKSHQGSDNCQEESTFARSTTEPPGLEFSTPHRFFRNGWLHQIKVSNFAGGGPYQIGS